MATSVEAPILAPRPARTPVRRERVLFAVAEHSLVIVLAAMFLAPFLFMVLTGLMPAQQALTPKLFPDPFRLATLSDVFDKAPLLRSAGNPFLSASLAPIGVRSRACRWRTRSRA